MKLLKKIGKFVAAVLFGLTALVWDFDGECEVSK